MVLAKTNGCHGNLTISMYHTGWDLLTSYESDCVLLFNSLLFCNLLKNDDCLEPWELSSERGSDSLIVSNRAGGVEDLGNSELPVWTGGKKMVLDGCLGT